MEPSADTLGFAGTFAGGHMLVEAHTSGPQLGMVLDIGRYMEHC